MTAFVLLHLCITVVGGVRAVVVYVPITGVDVVVVTVWCMYDAAVDIVTGGTVDVVVVLCVVGRIDYAIVGTSGVTVATSCCGGGVADTVGVVVMMLYVGGDTYITECVGVCIITCGVGVMYGMVLVLMAMLLLLVLVVQLLLTWMMLVLLMVGMMLVVIICVVPLAYSSLMLMLLTLLVWLCWWCGLC